MTRATLESCICGQHDYCPDGWHSDDEAPCSCTPDCVLCSCGVGQIGDDEDHEPDCEAADDHGPGCDGPLNCTCEPGGLHDVPAVSS